VAARPAAGGVLDRAGAGPRRAVVCRKAGSYVLYNYSGVQWRFLPVPLWPDNRLQYDVAGTLGNGSWGYTAVTYDKDAGPDNQRLYLDGTRVAQMNDTQPGSQLEPSRHRPARKWRRRSLQGPIDEFRIAHVQGSDGWIETT
jgi:hypothetical protein